MSDFLDSLVQRSIGTEATLAPRVPSRFEPVRAPQLPSPQNRDADGLNNDATPAVHTIPRDGILQIGAAALTALPLPESAEQRPTQSQHSVRAAAEGSFATNASLGNQARQAGIERTPELTVGSSANFALAFDDTWLHERLDELTRQFDLVRGSLHNPPDESRRDSHSPSREPLGNESNQIIVANRATAIGIGPIATNDRSQHKVSDTRHASVTISRIAPPESRNTERHRSNRTRAHQPVPPVIQPLPAAKPPQIIPESLTALARQTPAAEPTVNVTIGRVEIKAIREPSPVPARGSEPTVRNVVMSLDEYLERRAKGGLG